MNRTKLSQRASIAIVLTLGLLLIYKPMTAAAADQEGLEQRPARLIRMAVEYPGVEVPLGDDVSMDIIFYNKGRSDEDVDIRLAEAPEGWKAVIKTYRYNVSAVHVPSGEDKTLTFEAEPGETVKPGEYTFRIAAQTTDGEFKMSRRLKVKVRAQEEDRRESKGVKLTTSYPVLRGPSDVQFEFSLEVDSKLDEDAVFDLFAQGPEGWEINFKPAYESKFISSLRLKANQSSTVAVQVKPALNAQAGEFPVNIRVTSGDATAEGQLMVILTGTYELDVGTPNGLLSLDARQGKPANLSFYVKNTGSATNSDISFMSFKPENWNIEFKPEKIPALKPDELQQVEVNITPYEDALVGDYSVSVKVDGERASKTSEFRVTVKASAAWSWIGIAVIVVVIAGLTFLFRRLGRR
jgi:uncharacterized membrane protein